MSLIKLYLATRCSAVACGTFAAKSHVRSGQKGYLLNIRHPKSEASWIMGRLEHNKPLERGGCPFSPHTEPEFSIHYSMLE